MIGNRLAEKIWGSGVAVERLVVFRALCTCILGLRAVLKHDKNLDDTAHRSLHPLLLSLQDTVSILLSCKVKGERAKKSKNKKREGIQIIVPVAHIQEKQIFPHFMHHR